MKLLKTLLHNWREIRKKKIIERSRLHAIMEANRFRDLTGATHYVMFVEGRFRAYNRHVLKGLIRKNYFKRGVTIEHLENSAIYTARSKPFSPQNN